MEAMTGSKLILIGLDGATFDVIVPHVRKGLLPTFGRIMNEGANGTLLSTVPFNTLPAWTSIFTGVNPGKHGIADFMIRKDNSVVVPAAGDRMVDSLWRILDRNGVKQIIVNEPVTYPPEKINGVMVSGFLIPRNSRDYAHPSSVLDEIEKHCGNYIPELEPGFEKSIAKDPQNGIRIIDDFAKSTFRASEYLARNYEWDLLAVIFTSTDRLQHFYFNDQSVLLHHYQLIDGMISRLMELDKEANLMLVSDHGFGALKKCFYANTWLEAEGRLQRRSDGLSNFAARHGFSYPSVRHHLERMKVYGLARKVVPMRIKQSLPESGGDSGVADYSESSAFCPGTGNGIFLAERGLKDQEGIIGKLKEFSVGQGGPLQEVSGQSGKIWGSYASRGPDILLIPAPGYEISSHLVDQFLAPPNQFGDTRTGTHRPEGVFMAIGPKIARTSISRPLHVWDVTPTILELLGLPRFTYMDGDPIEEIFREGEIRAEGARVQVSQREILRQRIREFKGRK